MARSIKLFYHQFCSNDAVEGDTSVEHEDTDFPTNASELSPYIPSTFS